MIGNLTAAAILRLIGIANESRERATVQGILVKLPTEAERQRARRILLAFYQRQQRQLARKEIADIDPLLVQAVKDWSLRCSSNPKPDQAWGYFLGTLQKRGKRTKIETAERDFEIALAVARKMGRASDPKSKRMTLEKAAAAVKSESKLKLPTVGTIKNIYQRHSIAARCALAFDHWPHEANASITWEQFLCEPREPR